MKLEDLEKYRTENGFIDMDLALKENELEYINEIRGSQNRDKFWVVLEDTEILIRNENLDDCGVEYPVYAELIMEELAKQVGLDCAHYDIINFNGKKGVISKNVLDRNKNESMYTIRSIIGEDAMPNDSIDIAEVWNSIKKFASMEDNISKEKAQKAFLDVAKIAIFDTYTMSNDRHSENISLIYGNDAQEGTTIFKVAPLFDNECSLMLDKPVEEIDEMLSDKKYFNDMVNLQEQMIVVPDEAKDPSNVDGWKDMLYFLTDDSDEAMDFAEECYNTLDIKEAMESVESRISAKLPEKLKEFVTKSFEIRKDSINRALIINMDDMEVGR